MSRITGVLRGVGRVSGGISKPTTAQVEEYTGDYEFTPTRSTQVIEIANKKATADITINPSEELISIEIKKYLANFYNLDKRNINVYIS